MQTRALRSFVKISQVGSFLRASEHLNMTLSALSMQMKSLEAELGADLFDRAVRPPRLTPIGRALVERASDILEREDALIEFCSSEDELAGKFRIGFVTSAAARMLPAFLEHTGESIKRAEFEFETGLSEVLLEKVRAGSLDAAVVTDTEVHSPGLSHVVLHEESFVFAAHSSIAVEGLDALISKHTFFQFMPQTGIGKVIAKAMEETARSADATTITLDNLEAIMGCVKNRLGFTLLPEPDVERYADATLTKFQPPDSIRRSLVLVTRGDGVLAKRLDLLAAQF